LAVGSSQIYKLLYNTLVAFIAIATFTPIFKYHIGSKLLYINKLGALTLGVYAIHKVILALIPLKALDDLPHGEYYLFIIAFWIVLTAISCVLVILLEKNNYTALLFLGKPIKKKEKNGSTKS
jgi:hypothetical protein